jgi:hypothetical protein
LDKEKISFHKNKKRKLMKYILILLLAFLYPELNRAQLVPSRGDYFTVEVTTQKVVYKDENPEEVFSLKAGTTIRIRMIDNDKIYFQLTNDNGRLKRGSLYYVSKAEFTGKYFSPKFYIRSGILVTPFKYRPDKLKFYPGGNLAAAGSVTYSLLGIGIQPLLFAGLTAITVSGINENQAVTETKWGFTTGAGFNLDITETLNIGIVSGWDYIEPGWESNGKMWLAFSFNFKFLE